MYVIYFRSLGAQACDVNIDVPCSGSLWLVPGTFDEDGECLPEFDNLLAPLGPIWK
jgi:hypothetical protein